MLAFALAAATEAADEKRHLPMPPIAYGLLAIGFFATLFFVTLAFRSVGTKH